jgi:S1-C subfamily serine protease
VSVREVVTPSDGTTSVAAVGRKVTPSVVTVMVGDETAGTEFNQFGLGSGVVLDAGGLVVTNAHVIEGSDATRIVLQDGTAFDSTVVGVDERTDLAVLRVDGAVFEAIEIGSTGNLEIGDVAIAVGNPLGLAGGASLTAGVVSAFEREVATPDAPTLFGMLQTDAPITRGSSGGALVDVEGRLIGITTAIGVSSGVAEGIGFAIPVELVSRIADEIITSGEVHHAFLGVRLDTYREDRGDGGLTPSGAVVTSFPDDVLSAAAAAGIREGDVIVTFEGETVTKPEEVISAVRLFRVGDSVTVGILREDATMTFEVELGQRPDDL